MDKLLDFVEELSFVRVGGSAEEKRAAELVLREIHAAADAALGSLNTGSPSGAGNVPPDRSFLPDKERKIRGELMPFRIPAAKVKRCSVRAGGRELPCAPFLRSGNIDRECRLVYLDGASEIDFAGAGDLEGAAVLLNELTDEDVYKRLIEHHASAFLVLKGKYYFTAEEASLYPNRLRERFSRYGVIPGFYISAGDANALIQEGAESVYLTLEQENTEAESQNVLAVIEGTDKREESVVLTAHYDSVPLGTGAWDNATGAAALLGIFGHFAANPPKRTLRFIWCGSEELGLLGSRAYVEQHPELLDKIQFCFNFDMCGTALGTNEIFITGEKELETFVEQYCKIAGYSARRRACVQSSDSAPFCCHDIPALGLSRGTSISEIHTIHDRVPVLNEKAIRKNVEFAVRIIGDIANAAVLPVKKGMPEERQKELERFR